VKRTPLSRGTKPLRRRTPLRPQPAKTRKGAVRLEESKAEVAGRSGGWCEAATPACVEGRHLAHHFHHMQMRSQGGKHDAANLLHVCSPAHDWIHRNTGESYRRGWLRHREAS
jgi:hypothetical protein